MPPTLPTPARYFPFESGRHDARAGLFKLGVHAVHGQVESNAFMLDDQYGRFISNKAEVRGRLHRHYVAAAPSPGLLAATIRLIASRLAHEWPQWVDWDESSGLFVHRLLGWSARLHPETNRYTSLERTNAPYADAAREIAPLDAIDLLASTLCEDIALVSRDAETGEEWLPLLHVCAPHHWDPREKLGRPFAHVHAPVADAAPLIAQAPRLMRAVIEQGPFLRFAWGPAGNDRLNHHPEAEHGRDRSGEPVVDASGWFIRVERQVLWGFPEAQGALFTIRPYWYPMEAVASDPIRRLQLADALADMSPAALTYKSFATARDPLVAWLRGGG